MPQYTVLTETEIAHILSQYEGIGLLESFEVLSGGLANTNVKVITQEGKYLLKICDEKTTDQLETQLEVLLQLTSNGFCTARPYPLKNTSACQTLAERYVFTDGKIRTLLFNFLPGNAGTRDATTLVIANQLGTAVGQLSSITPPPRFLELKPPYPPGFADIDPFLKEISGTPHEDHPFVKRYLKDMLSTLRSVVEDPSLPMGLVHGDIFPDNCMYDNDTLVAIFDFEEVSYSPLILDIAITIVGCFYRSDGTLDREKTFEFLQAYQRVRQLTRRELQVLPQMVQYALITLAFWRYRQFNIRRPMENMKDYYKEFTDRIDNGEFDAFYQETFYDVLISSTTKMTYKSTRGKLSGHTFEETLLSGYAPDGGLFVPTQLPVLPLATLRRWSSMSYAQIVTQVITMFVPESEIPYSDLSQLVDEALKSFSHPDVLPIKKLDDLYILEMFHGSTGAFKDLALSIMAKMLDYFLQKSGKRATVVVGTSGDTGSASIHSIKGSNRVNLIVLYPHGRISRIQELQMITCSAKNIAVFACDGTSDDLDEPIKNILNDQEFVRQHSVISINSINWCRVCIQTAHYFYGYFRALRDAQLPVGTKMSFAVPTGACGNLVGGWLAASMGLPVDHIIAAVNSNDIIHRFLQSGVFSVAPTVVQTISPSMDIQVPYNIERLLFYASQEDTSGVEEFMNTFYQQRSATAPHAWLTALRKVLITCAVDHEGTTSTIVDCKKRFNYLIDPHSAIGVAAARTTGLRPVICLATATPFKFTEVMESLLGEKLESSTLTSLESASTRNVTMLRREDNWEKVVRTTIEQWQ